MSSRFSQYTGLKMDVYAPHFNYTRKIWVGSKQLLSLWRTNLMYGIYWFRKTGPVGAIIFQIVVLWVYQIWFFLSGPIKFLIFGCKISISASREYFCRLCVFAMWPTQPCTYPQCRRPQTWQAKVTAHGNVWLLEQKLSLPVYLRPCALTQGNDE